MDKEVELVKIKDHLGGTLETVKPKQENKSLSWLWLGILWGTTMALAITGEGYKMYKTGVESIKQSNQETPTMQTPSLENYYKLKKENAQPNQPRQSQPKNSQNLEHKIQNTEKSIERIKEKNKEKNPGNLQKQYNLDNNFDNYIKAIIKIESDGNPNAERYEKHINDASYGLMQILTKTAKSIEKKHPELPRLGMDVKLSLLNPEINIAYGSALFKDELEFYNDPILAASAYNSGHLAPRNALTQHQLNELLKTSIETDGSIGRETRKAIKKFQQKYGLKSDSKLNPATLQKIQQIWQAQNPGKTSPKGIVPKNRYTPSYAEKFKKYISEI